MAKQPYYKKRVDIFEQYYQREQEKAEKAKADNKQIKVLAPCGGLHCCLMTRSMSFALLLTAVKPVHEVVITLACPDCLPAQLQMMTLTAVIPHSGSTPSAVLPLQVTLPDGGVKEGVAGVTTPLDIANAISTSLGKKVRCLSRHRDNCCLLIRTHARRHQRHVSRSSLCTLSWPCALGL